MKQIKLPLRAQIGITLVEVMVSLLILCVGILGITSVYPMVFKGIHNSWSTAQTIMVAQQTMDYLLSKNVFIDQNHVLVNPPPPELPKDSSGKAIGYVEYWGEAPQPPLLNRTQVIHVQVVWKEMGRTKKYKISGCVMP
jgi:competence protein ComGC